MKYDIIRFYDNKGNPRYPVGRADALWREDGVKTLENEFVDLYNRFNNVITNTTTNEEIVDARYNEITQTTYATLYDRLKAIDTNLDEINSKTNRIFKPNFGVNPYWGQLNNENGSSYSNTLTQMKSACDKYEEMGLDSIAVSLKCGGNVNTGKLYIAENLDYICDVIDYVADKNIKVKCIKLYRQRVTMSNYPDFKEQWKERITEVLEKFKDKNIEYFICFNEMEDIYNDPSYHDWIIEIIQLCQSYGFKTGISTTGWSLPLNNDFYDASDVIFPNLYPSMGKRGKYTKNKDIINAFQQADRMRKLEQCHLLNPDKPIIVNEIGVQDYWIALQAPSAFTWEDEDKVPTNGQAGALLMYGVFEMFNKDYIKEVWWWFDIYFEPTKKLCQKYLKGVDG